MVTPISYDSALLRARLAGRQQPGKCFRSYPEKAKNDWAPMIQPEIKFLGFLFEGFYVVFEIL
jgi:HrpA-like RNA helicase